MKMTDTEILDWLDAEEVYAIDVEHGTIVVALRGIRAAVIQARDNQDEAAGMRHYEGLRG